MFMQYSTFEEVKQLVDKAEISPPEHWPILILSKHAGKDPNSPEAHSIHGQVIKSNYFQSCPGNKETFLTLWRLALGEYNLIQKESTIFKWALPSDLSARNCVVRTVMGIVGVIKCSIHKGICSSMTKDLKELSKKWTPKYFNNGRIGLNFAEESSRGDFKPNIEHAMLFLYQTADIPVTLQQLFLFDKYFYKKVNHKIP